MKESPVTRVRLLAFALLTTAFFAPKIDAATPALVLDIGSHAVLYAEDAGKPWYPASTTKLMTALVAFEALRDGEVTLDTPVVMSKQAMSQKSLESGLKVGRAMRLEDALYAAFAGSANDVAFAIAETVAGSEAAFVERMNAEARRLGLTATHYANANGLFDPAQHVSARDLAVLAMTVYESFPQYRPVFATARVEVDGKSVNSFNALLTRYPGAVGMKTGFLCDSGRNLVGLAERDHRKIMVILLGATTDRERAERAAKFMTEAFEGKLEPTGTTVSQIENRPQEKPDDMRRLLCTPQGAAYEAEREALFPMGLPGQESYLGAEIPPTVRVVTTWQVEEKEEPESANVPIPTPRPEG